MRVPRKKKKHYKKLWAKRLGYDIIIEKSSIKKSDEFEGTHTVWGCVVRPRNKKNYLNKGL